KAIIKAPIDGLVTKITAKRGEFISSAAPMVQMLSNHYEVKVDVPETDIPKIKIGDRAIITLDAFGDDLKFSGKVLTVELASTEIQDVVYYRVTVTVDPGAKEIKSGMTANVTLATDRRSNVLAVPIRAIKTNDGKKVQVLELGQPREVAVEVGLRADDGQVEILSGLQEGQEVIISVKAE
ncbi:MAG: HlyD family efflux transporter periplasmic adaptor subunit, partial [Patescibacteria group bacterium]